MPKLDDLLAGARSALIKADVATPALDARLLLQQALAITHAELIAEIDRQPTDDQQQSFAAMLARRLAGEPVSRILGWREFYGRAFKTSSAVLDPRADTEALVELCLAFLPPDKRFTLLDLGTGSGILAVTLASERPLARAVAVDVSPSALAVASANAVQLGVSGRIDFVECSWFGAIQGQFDLIVSNPPYIPSPVIPTLEVEVRGHDPHLALDGGDDGLAAYRAIAAGAAAHLNTHGVVAVEIGAGQQHDVEKLFREQGFTRTAQRHDLGGHVRALAFRAPMLSRSPDGNPDPK